MEIGVLAVGGVTDDFDKGIVFALYMGGGGFVVGTERGFLG